MGGIIACAARLTDKENTVVKFEVSTGFFHKTFNDPRNSLNEENFINKIKEHELFNKVDDKNKLIFDEYGLVFIDFKTKKYFWMNNYSSLAIHDSSRFLDHRQKKAEKFDYEMTLREGYIPETNTFKKNEKFKIWDKPLGHYDAYCFLHQSLAFASCIKFNDKLIKNKKHIKELIPYFKEDSGIYGEGSISDIVVIWDDWDGHDGFGDEEDLTKLLDYLKQELLVNDEIVKLWIEKFNKYK